MNLTKMSEGHKDYPYNSGWVKSTKPLMAVETSSGLDGFPTMQ